MLLKTRSRSGQVLCLPYSIGQSSHRPVQIQWEEKQSPTLYGMNIKEFAVILILLQVISEHTDVT